MSLKQSNDLLDIEWAELVNGDKAPEPKPSETNGDKTIDSKLSETSQAQEGHEMEAVITPSTRGMNPLAPQFFPPSAAAPIAIDSSEPSQVREPETESLVPTRHIFQTAAPIAQPHIPRFRSRLRLSHCKHPFHFLLIFLKRSHRFRG